MKVVVCGSRRFPDELKASAAIVGRMMALPTGTTVIHGKASGADTFAGDAARRAGHEVDEFPADWETHSEDCDCKNRKGWCREAGKRRNLLMLDEEPDLVIAFWNGSSHGTRHTMKAAHERGIPVEVIRL